MAKVIKFGNRFRVVHSVTGVPTSLPTFKSRAIAKAAALKLRCKIRNRLRKIKRTCR